MHLQQQGGRCCIICWLPGAIKQDSGNVLKHCIVGSMHLQKQMLQSMMVAQGCQLWKAAAGRRLAACCKCALGHKKTVMVQIAGDCSRLICS
jgi:hypothetical protein